MRFYLDNDVDHRCRAALVPPHECWTASEAGMSNDTDDDQMVYAMNHAAVLITHDKEFTRRRKRFTIGQHVRLCCEQPDGPNLLRTHIDELVPMLLALPHVVIEVAPHGCDLTIGWG